MDGAGRETPVPDEVPDYFPPQKQKRLLLAIVSELRPECLLRAYAGLAHAFEVT